MSEHTKTDGLPGLEPPIVERAKPRNERMAGDKVECNACPVLCQISEGRTGACDRYANSGGKLVRVDPVVLIRKTSKGSGELVPFSAQTQEVLEGPESGQADEVFVTGIGASTT